MVCESTIHVAFYHNRNCMLSFKIPALLKNSNKFSPLAKEGLLEIIRRRNFKYGEKNTGELREKHATQCNEGNPNESENRLPWRGQLALSDFKKKKKKVGTVLLHLLTKANIFSSSIFYPYVRR